MELNSEYLNIRHIMSCISIYQTWTSYICNENKDYITIQNNGSFKIFNHLYCENNL